MTPNELIDQIKTKAVTYAKTHATENAKTFYILGKRDAASTFLAMVRADGWEAAITDVANEIIKHDPKNEHAQWILENGVWKTAEMNK